MRLREVGTPRRLLCFDLESRPSAYWFDGRTTAEITAFGWKWSDEDTPRSMVLTRSGRFHDGARTISYRAAYQRFRGELVKAGVVYGHNIRGFDLPLLQAGLLRLELAPLPPLLTTDTLRDIPRTRDMSRSLENLARLYALDEKGKLHMAIVDWERANRLGGHDVESARARVTSDVLLQVALRERLLDLRILGTARTWRP